MRVKDRILWLLGSLLPFILVDCATYSTSMVHPDGRHNDCAATGFGLLGLPLAYISEESCVSDLRNDGFMEVDKVGKAGMALSHSGPPLVLRVLEGSPADSAGVKAGDTILTVDGAQARTTREALTLMFGKVGRVVHLRVHRDLLDTSFTFALIKIPDSTLKHIAYPANCELIQDRVKRDDCEKQRPK